MLELSSDTRALLLTLQLEQAPEQAPDARKLLGSDG